MNKPSNPSLVPDMQVDLARCYKWLDAFGNKIDTASHLKELVDGVVLETIKECIAKLDDKESIDRLKAFIKE